MNIPETRGEVFKDAAGGLYVALGGGAYQQIGFLDDDGFVLRAEVEYRHGVDRAVHRRRTEAGIYSAVTKWAAENVLPYKT
jgi:hypothetical protein